MGENPKKEKSGKKKQAEIRLFTSTIQIVQESSRTDPYSPIFGHIKVSHSFNGFLWCKLISTINNNIKKRPA